MDCEHCTKSDCAGKQKNAEESEESFQQRQRLAARLCQIKHKVVVLSGKGGVGKSTVAVNLAVGLARQGFRTGLLDVDLHGPSIPVMLHLQQMTADPSDDGIAPVSVGDNLKVISVAFFLRDDAQAVIWRGPMKLGVIKQFLADVNWGELDFLIIDSPPGTGDEPLAVCQLIEHLDGGVIVTTPQDVAAADVRRSISFCEQLKLPVIGVVENMSGFRCPHCGKTVDIFRRGGGKKLAEDTGLRFLGAIPLDPRLVEAGDDGTPFVSLENTCADTVAAFQPVLQAVKDLQKDDR